MVVYTTYYILLLHCESILFIERKLVLGVVNNPMTGHMYTAIKGRGAYVNGKRRLSTSGVKKLADAMVLMELPVRANEDKRSKAVDNIVNLMEKAHSIRCPGKPLFYHRTSVVLVD